MLFRIQNAYGTGMAFRKIDGQCQKQYQEYSSKEEKWVNYAGWENISPEEYNRASILNMKRVHDRVTYEKLENGYVAKMEGSVIASVNITGNVITSGECDPCYQECNVMKKLIAIAIADNREIGLVASKDFVNNHDKAVAELDLAKEVA